MRFSEVSTLLIVAAALLFGVNSCAHAYIDPGTASAIWVAGLAPILAALGFAGRWLIRLFVRERPQEETEEPQAAEPQAEDPAETEE